MRSSTNDNESASFVEHEAQNPIILTVRRRMPNDVISSSGTRVRLEDRSPRISSSSGALAQQSTNAPGLAYAGII